MHAVLLLAILLTEEKPTQVERVRAAMEAAHDAEVAELERTIETAKKNLKMNQAFLRGKSKSRTNRSPKQIVRDIKKHRAALKKLNKSKSLEIPPLQIKTAVGDIGNFSGAVTTITQIANKSEVLIEAHWAAVEYTARGNQLVRKPRTYSVDFWLRGLDTSKLSDGKGHKFGDTVFECTGNHRYVTVSGATKTVLVLEPIPQEVIEQATARTGQKKKNPRRRSE